MLNFTIMKIALPLLVWIGVYPAFTQNLESIQEKLEDMAQQNIELRSRVMPTIRNFGFDSPQMDSLNRKILYFDSVSLVFVTSIIEEHGWLGKSKIGGTANGAIFLTIQHAPDNNIRKEILPTIREVCKRRRI